MGFSFRGRRHLSRPAPREGRYTGFSHQSDPSQHWKVKRRLSLRAASDRSNGPGYQVALFSPGI
jgi:hypothetical protein